MDPQRILNISEPAIGLEAVIVLDSTALGPAAGGVRTARYASLADATAEACALARSMTLKCSLAGLDAGGGKAVIVEQESWDRGAVFRRFGEIVQELRGEFRTAGDLGTTQEDLLAMATSCEYVHTEERGLGDAVALGLQACMEVLGQIKERELSSLKVAVQGCGAIGSALARQLHDRVAELYVADVDQKRAAEVADQCGAATLAPEAIIAADVDLLSPCAMGGAIRQDNAKSIRAWGLCGGANLIVADPATQSMLHDQGLLVVPDLIASSGAVIDGIGDTVMGLNAEERRALILALGDTAREVLAHSRKEQVPTQRAAESLALARLS